MPRFFIENPTTNTIVITGDNASHISKSLRMKVGDDVVICDGKANDYICKIVKIDYKNVVIKVLKCIKSESEPTIKTHLYQAMPKSNKFEHIIKKSVELGITEITPVLSNRCISRPNSNNIKRKVERYQKISEQAAKQSGRGIIPKVNPMLSFEDALNEMSKSALAILFYECGGKSLRNVIETQKEISFMVGSEGGFEPYEVEKAKYYNIIIGSLGKRILRCETVAPCVLSIIMYCTKNL